MSPPEIKKNHRMVVFFYFCDTGRRTRKRVRNASWQEQVSTPFAPYAVKGAHGAKANMGIYSPCVPTKNKKTTTRWFYIYIPQHLKPLAVFLRWVGQEDAIFTVILGGGGGPVIGTRHHTHIIKDCKFIMFNLVPAIDADGYANGDQFINHGRFMSGHSSVGDDADTGAPTMGGDNGIGNFRIGYGIYGNVDFIGPTQLGNYAVFAFGAGGEICFYVCGCAGWRGDRPCGQLHPNANPNGKRNPNNKSPLSDKHTTPNKRPLKQEWSGVSQFTYRTPLPLGQALLYSNSIPTIVGTLKVMACG